MIKSFQEMSIIYIDYIKNVHCKKKEKRDKRKKKHKKKKRPKVKGNESSHNGRRHEVNEISRTNSSYNQKVNNTFHIHLMQNKFSL